MDIIMLERKKEIEIKLKDLKAEQKILEKQKSDIQSELSTRENINKNLEIKYRALKKRQEGEDGHEHTQAYYIIKTS